MSLFMRMNFESNMIMRGGADPKSGGEGLFKLAARHIFPTQKQVGNTDLYTIRIRIVD